jgi:putative transcriptional regulator
LADAGEPFAGALLVATPLIEEPTFRRSLVLILEHQTDAELVAGGTLGVVINDISAVPAQDVVPGWSTVLHSHVGVGGPVQTDAGVALARLADAPSGHLPDGVRPLTGLWALLDLDADPDDLAGSLADAGLFMGYAGWAPGQLDNELAEGSWWVVDSRPDDLALARQQPREVSWAAVLRRQHSDLRFACTFPPDPALN